MRTSQLWTQTMVPTVYACERRKRSRFRDSLETTVSGKVLAPAEDLRLLISTSALGDVASSLRSPACWRYGTCAASLESSSSASDRTYGADRTAATTTRYPSHTSSTFLIRRSCIDAIQVAREFVERSTPCAVADTRIVIPGTKAESDAPIPLIPALSSACVGAVPGLLRDSHRRRLADSCAWRDEPPRVLLLDHRHRARRHRSGRCW